MAMTPNDSPSSKNAHPAKNGKHAKDGESTKKARDENGAEDVEAAESADRATATDVPATNGATTSTSSDAQAMGVATADDAALAERLAASQRNFTPAVSSNVVELFRAPDLVQSLHTHRTVIEEQNAGTVDGMLARIPDNLARREAHGRLGVSLGRMHQSLVDDNSDFMDFATAVVKAFRDSGPGNPIKADKAIAKLADNRDVQRNQQKATKTKKEKAKAKNDPSEPKK